MSDLRIFCANFRNQKVRWCYFLHFLHVWYHMWSNFNIEVLGVKWLFEVVWEISELLNTHTFMSAFILIVSRSDGDFFNLKDHVWSWHCMATFADCLNWPAGGYIQIWDLFLEVSRVCLRSCQFNNLLMMGQFCIQYGCIVSMQIPIGSWEQRLFWTGIGRQWTTTIPGEREMIAVEV